MMGLSENMWMKPQGPKRKSNDIVQVLACSKAGQDMKPQTCDPHRGPEHMRIHSGSILEYLSLMKRSHNEAGQCHCLQPFIGPRCKMDAQSAGGWSKLSIYVGTRCRILCPIDTTHPALKEQTSAYRILLPVRFQETAARNAFREETKTRNFGLLHRGIGRSAAT